MKKFILLFFTLSFLLVSCKDDDSSTDTNQDSFDRGAMLTHWADNIIIPSYANFANSAAVFRTSAEVFLENPSVSNLENLREDYKAAYIDFQSVSMFEIGPAETIGFRGFMNTYPTNTTAIENIIQNFETPNLELPSSRDAQGFPATDYLLYGIADSDAAIVDKYLNGDQATPYKTYLDKVSKRIKDLSALVLNDWNDAYRDDFVSNTSSSSTGSVDRLANDFIIHFEKYIRSAKVGIPAGVFSGNEEPQTVESYYNPTLSKTLLKEALLASKDFFTGKSFGQTTNGPSFKDYLDYMDAIKETESLSELILNKYQENENRVEELQDNLLSEVQNNNTKMLDTYDSLQENVILLKIDMLQALSISVDYVDTDGD